MLKGWFIQSRQITPFQKNLPFFLLPSFLFEGEAGEEYFISFFG